MKTSASALVLFSLTLAVKEASAGLFSKKVSPDEHYKAKCVGRGSDKHWPCWQIVQGSLNDAIVDTYEGKNQLYIEQGNKDFTVADTVMGYKISWNGGERELIYEGQGEDGCYSMGLYASGKQDIRITSDDGVVATTLNAPEIPHGRSVHISSICSKWAQVYVL